GELGHTNTKNIKTKDGSVVVRQKEDKPTNEVSDATVDIEKIKGSGVSKQSIVAVAKRVEAQSNPVGPMAKDSSPADEPFVIVKPPKDIEPKTTTKQKNISKVKKVGDTIIVDGLEDVRKLKPDKDDSYDTQVATKDESGAIIMKVKEVAKTEDSKPKKTEKPKVVKVTKKKAKKKVTKKKTSKKKNS
ncbi:unnamed protein product, partial [marine sediment metagenome]